MSSNETRPFISHAKEYIQKVAESIPARAPLEDIPFHLLTDVLEKLGIKESPYHSTIDTFDDERIKKLAHESFQAIPEIPDEDLSASIYKLWDYLAEADQLKPADLIFVFGSSNEQSPRTAARLYLEHYSPHILFTGHSAAYQEKVGMAEAERFAQIARELGVPREAMTLETASRNTPENVINGLKIIREWKLRPKTIILITYSFHMHRAYLTFRSVLDWNAELIRQPVDAEEKRENFFRDEKRWTYIFFEFIKLYGGRMMKHF